MAVDRASLRAEVSKYLNECGACGLDFASVRAFDEHRVGVHAYLFAEGLAMDPPREDGRRCLAPGDPEFDARFYQDAKGRYALVKSRGVAAKYFSEKRARHSSREK